MVGNSHYSVIVGLGKTGLSVARYLLRNDRNFVVMDSRSSPPEREALKRYAPQLKVGPLDERVLCDSDEIILSPGVPLAHPAIARALHSGVPVIGDVEIFARTVNAGQKIAAITGTNGKSTVSHLLNNMARSCGLKVALGGNVGTPVLDLLAMPSPGLFVLELSSFQLETTHSLRATVAAILNVAEDHLDRHQNLDAYANVKARILNGCAAVVIGRDCVEQFVSCLPKKTVTFGEDEPDGEHFGLLKTACDWEIFRGKTCLTAGSSLTGLPGMDGLQNAQAALALGETLGFPYPCMLKALATFQGLPHRFREIGTLRGATWIDDSKATNVAAAIAALRRTKGHCVWIAGGVGKGADFAPLAAAAKQWAHSALLFGRDAQQIAKAIGDAIPVYLCDDLDAAVARAARLAREGDCVLLAPGCASMDMFENYADRGRCFAKAFESMCQEHFARNENDAA